MKSGTCFVIIGIVMILGESLIGFLLFAFYNEIKILLWATGLIIMGFTLLVLIVRTEYDPFSEFSCWAFVLSTLFFVLAFSLFPYDFSSPIFLLRIYNSSVSFSIAIYLTSWNLYALIRKKQQDGTENGI